jgi:MFS family permease
MGLAAQKLSPKLGLKANWYQFTLLVIVNTFVGAMIGLERTILPQIAEQEFGLAVKSAILSFIVVFGLTKAITNYFAGRWSDQFGRKKVLLLGWLFAIPVPFLLMWAPSWSWILVANFFLGVSQGLTWSTTVIMKIDLVGAERRGLAMGLNEFAGYLAVALSALATGFVANHFSLRPEPFYLGIVYVFAGLWMSLLMVHETKDHVTFEANLTPTNKQTQFDSLSQKEIFARTTLKDKNLSSVTQAGFVNNLNDGMAWGLFPILFASHGLTLEKIGWLAAIYPATWGLFQLWTGHASDTWGRKGLITWGMWIQAIGILITMLSEQFLGFALGGVLLGVGTAMVYPTLLAVIGDIANPAWRASSVGIYRFWRDSGYAVGALVSGIVADFFGMTAAIGLVALMTFLSGVVVRSRMTETLKVKG